jgi:hypothetical protein
VSGPETLKAGASGGTVALQVVRALSDLLRLPAKEICVLFRCGDAGDDVGPPLREVAQGTKSERSRGKGVPGIAVTLAAKADEHDR